MMPRHDIYCQTSKESALDWRQRRDNTNLRFLLEVAADHGVDAVTCLANTGLQDASERLEAIASVELWQELAVIRNLVAQHPSPGIGLQLGRHYHLTSLGLLGYAMLASRTLRDAIDVTSQFRPLSLSICPVQLQPHAAGLLMNLDESVLPIDARCLVVERGLTAWQCLFSELLQRPFVPLRVDMRVPGAGTPALYSVHFGCTVDTEAQGNSMLIAAADLDTPLPLANAMTQRTCASLCQHLCDSLDDIQAPLAHQVMQLLMGRSGQIHPAREVAAYLGLSERTLHRRLAEEGYPYRRLDERVRRNLAERLLRDSALGLESIAHQLGYAEAASFSRAFKRWTGLPPDHWRTQHYAKPLESLINALAHAHSGDT
jgi:AraC-like DNA-binding protein